MDRRFRERGLRVVGVHAPEFDREKDAANVRREAARLGLAYPVVLDNDFRMWDALENRYWPTLYLVDRKGILRHVHAGETREGSRPAAAFEAVLADLLAEPA
jgi:alkyl hydroperoxide reductase subunit AhpC